MIKNYHFSTSFYPNLNVFIGALAYQVFGYFRATLVTSYMKCCLPSSFMINLHRKRRKKHDKTVYSQYYLRGRAVQQPIFGFSVSDWNQFASEAKAGSYLVYISIIFPGLSLHCKCYSNTKNTNMVS